jgi:hypothetical protein
MIQLIKIKIILRKVYCCIAVQNIFHQRKLYRNQDGTLGFYRFGKIARLRIIAVKKIVSNGVARISV